MKSLYQKIKDAGIPINHYESDLYVLATDEARKLVLESGLKWSSFRSDIDDNIWLEIPFAYAPFWNDKIK